MQPTPSEGDVQTAGGIAQAASVDEAGASDLHLSRIFLAFDRKVRSSYVLTPDLSMHFRLMRKYAADATRSASCSGSHGRGLT
jgi:hypothetical protein